MTAKDSADGLLGECSLRLMPYCQSIAIGYRSDCSCSTCDLRARITAHLAQAGDGGWMPIETAPKTGESIIALSGRWRTVCNWNKHRGDWCISAPGYPAYPFDERPDHWHPLPIDPPLPADERSES